VGDVSSRQETIAQVGDLSLRQPKPDSEIDIQSQNAVKPAPANRQKRVAHLPGSNFDALDNLGPARRGFDKDSERRDSGWNEDYLETPTYLRKKAN